MVAPDITSESKPFQKGNTPDHLDAALAVKAVELNGLLTNKLLQFLKTQPGQKVHKARVVSKPPPGNLTLKAKKPASVKFDIQAETS